jgi:hypothetical protein
MKARYRYWWSLLVLSCLTSGLRADAFDRYTNPLLAKIPSSSVASEVKQLTFDAILEHDHVLPGGGGAFVVVKTNQGRFSKLLVAAGRQKLDDGSALPIVLIDRFTTYQEGQERATQAAGQHLTLFDGFRLHLDIGQVVPAALGGDLRFVAAGDKSYLEPIGNAQTYLVTRPLPEAAPPKTGKFVAGSAFEPRYINGTYKLHDDGRRSGTLVLKVGDDGEVTGSYYSDNGGRRSEVTGKVGTPRYSIQFTVHFPRSRQEFHGWLFTGDGKVLTGTSRLQDHEAGFYAVRTEDE